jgi:hypothetical protein
MLRRRVVSALVCATVAVLAFSGSASAATVVGNSCAANSSKVGLTIVSLKNPPGFPLPSAIPSSGVITSWTFDLGLPIPPGAGIFQEQLKVFTPVGGSQFKVAGESALGTIATGGTTFLTRLPVQTGDLIGSQVIASSSSEVQQGIIFCETEDPGDEVALLAGNPNVGTTASAVETKTKWQNPVTVSVEPDADGDGYGDETQDQCPTDASTQGPCPAPKVAPSPPPPAPPTSLSASAAAKKGLVTVTLTSSAQATVTVGGSVDLGKGKTAKLSGGTQIVAPGTLAKFTILFPGKLKAALKGLPSSKKLALKLTAGAPGATSTNLTVKVPGQKRAQPHHHGR